MQTSVRARFCLQVGRGELEKGGGEKSCGGAGPALTWALHLLLVLAHVITALHRAISPGANAWLYTLLFGLQASNSRPSLTLALFSSSPGTRLPFHPWPFHSHRHHFHGLPGSLPIPSLPLRLVGRRPQRLSIHTQKPSIGTGGSSSDGARLFVCPR